MSLVEIKHVSRHFHQADPFWSRIMGGKKNPVFQAVNKVSFSIKSGSCYALVGQSGSGKSTIAKMVTGLLKPSNGAVYIDGVNLYDPRLDVETKQAVRRKIQMVFQSPYASLNPRWRVGDILMEPIRAFKLIESKPAKADRVAELLHQVGLNEEDQVKYPHEFSGGQRQRISIARALASNPKIIICDEPTSALDVSVQAQILNLLKRLQKEYGLTYLFISHDLAVVSTMANWVGVLHQGCLIEQQIAKDLFLSPQTDYAKKLFNAIPKIA